MGRAPTRLARPGLGARHQVTVGHADGDGVPLHRSGLGVLAPLHIGHQGRAQLHVGEGGDGLRHALPRGLRPGAHRPSGRAAADTPPINITTRPARKSPPRQMQHEQSDAWALGSSEIVQEHAPLQKPAGLGALNASWLRNTLANTPAADAAFR